MEGKKYRPFGRDCSAVSEVIGQILMISVVVLAFSSIAVFVFSDEGAVNPPHTPKADLQESVDTGKDLVKIFHKGGEAIDLEDAKIILNINGEQEEFNLSSAGVSCNATNNVMMVGDEIVINTSLSRGRNLNSTDAIDMYFVDTESEQVIQRVMLQSGNKGSESSDDTGNYWITPHPNGTADDTSDGWISTEAVDKIGDGNFTTYYASDGKHGEDPNSTAQVFVFNISADEEGISEPPFENVTLRIVYSLHDKNYDYVALDIWDGNPNQWIRVGTNMPEYDKNFEAYDINLISYVTTIEELKNFKVRVVGFTHADKNAEKIAWIDFLGIHVE